MTGKPDDAEGPGRGFSGPAEGDPPVLTSEIGGETDVLARLIHGVSVQSAFSHHPIVDKFNDEHTAAFLENTYKFQTQIQRNYQSNIKWNRFFGLVYTLIGVAVFGFLTLYMLPDQKELYVEILKLAGAFAAGGFGGYGVKAYLDSR